MVYTFDVFDTLITRITAEPRGIFSLMQAKLCSNAEDQNFFYEHVFSHFTEYRLDAERLARQMRINSGKYETSLQHIYDVFAYMHGLPQELCEYLINLEMETEYNASIPIWKNICLVKQHIKEGSVFLITDMYLPQEEIRKLLVKHDMIFQHIPILVSSEYDKTKSSGKLFQYFLEKYGVSPTEWLHYGDNSYADGEWVQKLGGKWIEYDKCRNTERDQAILEQYGEQLDMQLVLGCIKRERISAEETSLPFVVGMEISAPILFGYVYWVLEKSMLMKIKNLYFIARDGYVLKEIADYIIEKEKLDIQTGYLYGSRYAWRLPAVGSSLDTLRRWFLNECTFSCISQLAEILGIEMEQLSLYIPVQIDYFASLTISEINMVKSSLWFQDELWIMVRENIESKRRSAIQYLKQEIGDKEDIGFVELNGTGYTQKCLKNLMSDFRDGNIITFYYAMCGMKDIERGGCRFIKFSYDDYYGKEIIELLCRTPYGQTMGYSERQGRYVPLFNSSVTDFIDKFTFEEYLSGIMASVKAFEDIPGSRMRCLDVSMAYVKYALDFSDKDLQIFIGDMPFSSYSYALHTFSYAPVITSEMMQKIELSTFRNEWRKYYAGENIEYSLKRSSGDIQDRMKIFLEQETQRPLNAYSNIKLKGRIILYGAGRYGERVYSFLSQQKEVEILHWVDKDYLNRQKIVEAPKVILTEQFDVILIAVINLELHMEICQEMLKWGVALEKIL